MIQPVGHRLHNRPFPSSGKWAIIRYMQSAYSLLIKGWNGKNVGNFCQNVTATIGTDRTVLLCFVDRRLCWQYVHVCSISSTYCRAIPSSMHHQWFSILGITHLEVSFPVPCSCASYSAVTLTLRFRPQFPILVPVIQPMQQFPRIAFLPLLTNNLFYWCGFVFVDPQ